MLLSLSVVLNFVMNIPAPENALLASSEVAAIVFKVSFNFIIFHDRFSMESKNCNSCLTILLTLESLQNEQRMRAFVFEWIAFSNFCSSVNDLSSKVSMLSSSECN